MDSSSQKVLLVVLFLEAISGMFSSFSVIACLLLKTFRRHNMATYIKILIPLNVSNLCFTSILSINFSLDFFCPELIMNDGFYYTTTYVTLYSITSSLWLSGVLCVFYFMKIMPSQPGVLTTLKSQIGGVVWWLVISAELVSLGGSFISVHFPNPHQNQRNSTSSASELMEEANAETKLFTNIILILNFLPFLVIMMTTIGSAWFLKLYNCQIQKNLARSGTSRVRDYRAAIQSMIGLLALYGSILVSVIIFALNTFPYHSWSYWTCVIFLFSFPTVFSALLICGNPKLKESFKQMFLHHPSGLILGDG
ncbi:taste receptor type 2 member 40-like [Leptodactylus fuscus]|uniref:taste receptor type 2 member 40-like n=1 Tax=Leptodactylus fuscus TaxID=238119 RepID=UPI003F4E4F3B